MKEGREGSSLYLVEPSLNDATDVSYTDNDGGDERTANLHVKYKCVRYWLS